MDAVKDGCKYILDKVKIEDLKRFLSVNREENKDEIIEAIQQHMSPREILHNRIVTIQHLWQYLQSKGYSASKTKKDTLVNDVLKFWESPNKHEMESVMRAGAKDILQEVDIERLKLLLSAIRVENKDDIIEAILNMHHSPGELLNNRIVTIDILCDYLKIKNASPSKKLNKDTLVKLVLKSWESPTQIDQPHAEMAIVPGTSGQTPRAKRDILMDKSCADEMNKLVVDKRTYRTVPIRYALESQHDDMVSVAGCIQSVFEPRPVPNKLNAHLREMWIEDPQNQQYRIKATLWGDSVRGEYSEGQTVLLLNTKVRVDDRYGVSLYVYRENQIMVKKE